MDIMLKVKRLPNSHSLPAYATPGSAGLDLTAGIEQPVIVQPGQHIRLPTGIIVEIPFGFEGQIRARSGLAARAGISLTNGIGTIDSDYRGELFILLINHGDASYTIEPGERVAQLVIAPVVRVQVVETDDLSFEQTSRGNKGFGSTGKISSPDTEPKSES